MSIVIPPDFVGVQVLLRHVSATHQGEITYGLDITSFTGTMAELADTQTTAYSDNFGTYTDIGVQIGPTLISVGAASPPYLRVDGTETLGGDVEGETMPSNVAALMRKRSLQAGRGGRGRNYLPWILRDNQVDDVGNVEATALSNLQDAADGWYEAAGQVGGTDGATPIVILHDSGASTAADDPAFVTSLSIDALVATQRRRLGR
jgi:hypothetical protein